MNDRLKDLICCIRTHPVILTACNTLLLALILILMLAIRPSPPPQPPERETVVIKEEPPPQQPATGPVQSIPPVLKQFLEESRTKMEITEDHAEKLQQTRRDLAKLINSLPQGRRDDLRARIRDANWFLEARQMAVRPVPEKFALIMGQLTSITALLDAEPADVPDGLRTSLEERSETIKTEIRSEFERIHTAFSKGDAKTRDEERLGELVVLGDALAGEVGG